MARLAASLRCTGAGKSGNPCARLTPPCCSHSRVMPRITDSVKRSDFRETVRMAERSKTERAKRKAAGALRGADEKGDRQRRQRRPRSSHMDDSLSPTYALCNGSLSDPHYNLPHRSEVAAIIAHACSHHRVANGEGPGLGNGNAELGCRGAVDHREGPG